MKRGTRLLGYFLAGLVAALLVVAALLFFLTRTEAGIERVRRFAISQVEQRVAGEVRVGRIRSPGLLGGATLEEVEIVDEAGRPFIRAGSVRVSYNWRQLAGGSISLSRVELFDVEAYLEKLPGDTLWNFERIFADTTPDEGPGPLILFRNARIHNGLLVVRFPWEPEEGEPVEPDDTARLVLRQVPGGLVRELRFEEIDAALTRVIWQTPVEEGRLFEVRSLATRGFIWEDPFQLEQLSGDVTIVDSVISFDVDAFRLPGTRGTALGQVVTGEDRTHFDVEIQGDTVATRDLRWLYPPLPEEGGGNLVFRMQTQPDAGTLWLAQDAHIRAPGTEIAGTFGIVTGDTLYFTQVDLRASPLNLELLDEVLPVDLPVEGLVVGTVEVEGPISSLTTRGDLRLVRAGAAGTASAVRWTGTVDLRRPFAVQNLDADVRTLELALLSALHPGLQLDGVVSGRIRATGRLDHGLRLAADIQHRVGDGPASWIGGQGTLRRVDGRPTLDAELTAHPVALEGLASALHGAARLRGEARGPVTLRGPLDDLTVGADLETGGGRLRLQGRLDLTRDVPRYEAEGRVDRFRLQELIAGLGFEEAVVDARFSLSGAGIRLDSTRSGLSVDLDSARIGRLAIRAGGLGLEVRDGVAHIDSLTIETSAGRLDARGTLGLESGRDGILTVRVDADSLVALRRIAFPDAPGPLSEDTMRSRLAGAGTIDAELRGSIRDLALDAEARFRDLVIDAVEVDELRATASATGIGADSLLRYRIRATAGPFDLYGQRLDVATLAAEYDPAGGRLVVDAGATSPDSSRYRLAAGYRWTGDGIDLDLREIHARTGAEAWALTAPARIRAGRDGLLVDDVLLTRGDGTGRLRADGRLPWVAEPATGDPAAAFRIEAEGLPLFALRRASDGEPAAIASLSGTAEVTGTALAPRIGADLLLSDIRIGDVELQRFEARLAYADRRLELGVEALQGGRTVLTGNGRIPLDLRLMPVEERRLAEPLNVDLRANGVTAALATALVDGFRDVEGGLEGVVSLRGTSRDPELGGRMVLRDGAATWQPTGVRYRGISGGVRLLRDQLVAVDATMFTGKGNATLSGTLDFESLADPTFDLLVIARNFQAARRRDVQAVGSGELRLRGRYAAPVVEGRLRVEEGVLYLDEVWRQYQIVALDELPFEVVDSTVVAERRTSEFLKNLRVEDFEVEVGRGTWLRGRNLNVEVAGLLNVAFDRQNENISITGSLAAVRGTYELYVAERLPARRFSVRQGTVDFDGTPGINPAFDIVAAYRVRTARGDPIDVQAVVTGTLQNPRVALRSDEEPPISESDLLSYLVFGRPTYELGGGESRQLEGYVSELASGVLLPTSLGYIALTLETFASGFGLDYVSITPGETVNGGPARQGEFLNYFEGSRLEVGKYVGDALYLAVTQQLFGQNAVPGARAEWRFTPTWTAQLFFEDRFARTRSYGLDPTSNTRIFGFFLFREWGF